MVLVPGIDDEGLVQVLSGGDNNWRPFVNRKLYTEAFIFQDDKILLGYKKRGFGKSLYSGFGGKVEPGETPIEAAHRELKEEAGIEAPLRYCGTLLFLSESVEWLFQIEIYRAETYTGVITETDEMRPQWFRLPSLPSTSTMNVTNAPTSSAADEPSLPSIPFDQMWEGDRHWFPLLLANRRFVGREDFEMMDGKERLSRWWFGVPKDGRGDDEDSSAM